jgi:hypothetical protein
MLRRVRWYLGGRQSKRFILARLTFEGGTDEFSRNVGNQVPTYPA